MKQIYNESVIFTLLCFLIFCNGLAFGQNSSVLSKGEWFKFGVTERGMYKIGYEELQNCGLDVENINPKNIAVYGTTNKTLPENNSDDRIDDLLEMAIGVIGEEDGKFNSNDEVVFYAEGFRAFDYNSSTKRFDYSQNIYSDTVYYFFTVKNNELGKRWKLIDNKNQAIKETINTFKDCIVHEEDSENLTDYGSKWFGESIGTGLEREFTFNLDNISQNALADIKVAGATGQNTEATKFYIYVDGKEYIKEIEKLNSLYEKYLEFQTNIFQKVSGNKIDIKLKYVGSSLSYLDYIKIHVNRDITFNGGNYIFYETTLNTEYNKVVMRINTDEKFVLLDISNPLNVSRVEYDLNENICSFNVLSDKAHSFMAYNSLNKPTFIGKVKNQNLHEAEAVNLVILVHPLFLEEAERLAKFKRDYEGLSVMVVQQEEIFNEYSGGKQDPTAVRMFLRDMYKRAPKVLRYLLLFGDGSFDYKGRVEPNTNYIVTYQDPEKGLKTGDTFIGEDYFGIFGENEGGLGIGYVNLGIGRFPAQTIKDAKVLVDKVIRYSTKSEKNMGSWKNLFLFMADDEDGNGHLKDAETTNGPIRDYNPALNVDKMYSDSFKKVTTAAGRFFPEVNQRMKERMEGDGVLIINYFGHAGETGWSEEKILTNDDVFKWTNYDKMPIIISATCQFGRFDLPYKTTTGEHTILHENGGSIATLTSTRLAYPTNNRKFCVNFFNAMLSMYEQINTTSTLDSEEGIEFSNAIHSEYGDNYDARLGDFFKGGKNISYDINNRQFSLLGDPSLKVSMPDYKMIVSSINGKSPNMEISASALDNIIVKGKVLDKDGEIADWWNGVATVTFYDKVRGCTTLGNSSSKTNFKVQNEILFCGEVDVVNGNFEAEFIVPKEINYSTGYARLSLYAYDKATFKEAAGYNNNIALGDININKLAEAQPPTINMLINNSNNSTFVVNYNTNGELKFNYEISDNIGLYVRKTTNGKDIEMFLDGEAIDFGRPSYDNGNFTKIWGEFILPQLSEGEHTITVKGFNICNLSAEKSYTFVLQYDNREITMTNTLISPNPANREDEITVKFDIIDNINSQVDVEVYVYNMNGKIVKVIKETIDDYSYKIKWNDPTLSAGLYLYKIHIKNAKGIIATSSCKHIIK